MNISLGKKAEHGISILFLFLAIILISTLVSGLIITQAHKLAGDGGKMLDKIEQGYKNLQITDITGFDGRDEQIEALNIDVKTFGKGTPLDIKDLSLSIGEDDFRTILRYRENGELTPGNDGYNTWVTENFENMANFQTVIDYDDAAIGIEDGSSTPFVDIDGDAIVDGIRIADSGPCAAYHFTHLCFILSSTGGVVYVPLINTSNGAQVTVNAANVYFDLVDVPIGDNYGYITIVGYTDGSGAIGLADGGAPFEVTGSYYSQPELLDTDLDDDGLDDYVAINNTHAIFFVSGLSSTITIPFGVNLNTSPQTLNVDAQVSNGHRYATLRITGTTNTVGELDEGVTFEVDPYNAGSGYFTIEYLRRGEHPLDGYFVPGDVVRFYAETYRSISINEVIRVQFYYKDLDSAMKYAYTGDTMPSKERIPMYPRI